MSMRVISCIVGIGYLLWPVLLTVWITANSGQFLKRWEYQTTLPASWEIYMQVKKQHLELDMEQWTGSKLGKESIKAVCCHPAYLTYMQSTSCEMLGWMEHKLESDGCMSLPTQRTWVWASSKRWWRTGKPGVLQSMGSQRVGHDWVTEQQLLHRQIYHIQTFFILFR